MARPVAMGFEYRADAAPGASYASRWRRSSAQTAVGARAEVAARMGEQVQLAGGQNRAVRNRRPVFVAAAGYVGVESVSAQNVLGDTDCRVETLVVGQG